jgi:hypothetical protein
MVDIERSCSGLSFHICAAMPCHRGIRSKVSSIRPPESVLRERVRPAERRDWCHIDERYLMDSKREQLSAGSEDCVAMDCSLECWCVLAPGN